MVLSVLAKGQIRNISAIEGQTVLQALQNADIFVEATCGGGGTCGKCLVQIDNIPRLACQIPAMDGMEVVVDGWHSDDFAIVNIPVNHEAMASRKGASYGLAIDIGTTTIALALVDLQGDPFNQVIFSHGVVNSQRALGADVISRIKAADEGHLDTLNQYVTDGICRSITYICEENNISTDAIKTMAVSGNTTMLHILMGISCHALGQYPFTPVFIDLQRKSFEEIFGTGLLSCEVLLLPGISTYVGADVAAGVLYGYTLKAEDEKKDGLRLLVDLGTNGELALFSQDVVIGTATAAGPAFEAGNISCGTGSIPGAIAKAIYNPKMAAFEYETIDGHKPIGICGSGVLDIAAQLVLYGFIDEVGSLEDNFTIAPGIVFTQKDVRELQLAKSAVRAGIEILLIEAGASYNDITTVYLAGGFGHTLNLESALTLGILPKEWRNKVKAIGNSSLAGGVQVLTNPATLNTMVDFTANAKEINLSAHPQFNDLFMEHMIFE